MTRTDLATASEHLERAADAAEGDSAERLREQAATMEHLSEADHGVDHGRLDRHEYTLRTIADDADEAVAEEIAAAVSAIRSFRETLEGV